MSLKKHTATSLIFVCHGIGGLLLKYLLYTYSVIRKRTLGVLFYSTPHDPNFDWSTIFQIYGISWSDDSLSYLSKWSRGKNE